MLFITHVLRRVKNMTLGWSSKRPQTLSRLQQSAAKARLFFFNLTRGVNLLSNFITFWMSDVKVQNLVHEGDTICICCGFVLFTGQNVSTRGNFLQSATV